MSSSRHIRLLRIPKLTQYFFVISLLKPHLSESLISIIGFENQTWCFAISLLCIIVCSSNGLLRYCDMTTK